ncbi:MFS transporter [Gammaproteobacteria bacterium]|nr:MFS transporter [Gammaproteobacteria bacterium]
MSETSTYNVNQAATIWSLCILGSVTPSVVLLGPLIVGGLVTELGFSPQAAGNMIFAELSGAGFATFPALYWISRINWRTVLMTSLIVMVACNIISAFMTDPWILGGVRFITGLGVGSTMAITMLTSGMTNNPERALSFWTMGQIIFAAIGLAIMPFILPTIGIKGFYIILAVIITVLIIPVRFMPEKGGESHQVPWSKISSITKRYAPIALIGLLFFYIAVGGLWNFYERIGDSAGFDARFIGLTLSGVSAIGVLGAICSAWLSLKWGRMTPFLIGIAALFVSMFILYGVSSQVIYIVSAFLFKYGWWFISPYLLANMSTLDPSGKLILGTNFVIGFGQALGPLIVGFTLVDSPDGIIAIDYTSAIHVGVVCMLVCCVLFYTVIKVNDREELAPSPQV